MPDQLPPQKQPSHCPACGTKQPKLAETSCFHCNAVMSLPIWQETRPAYLRIRFLATILDHILIALLISKMSPFFVSLLHQLFPLIQVVLLRSLSQTILYLLYFFIWTWELSTTPGKWCCRLRIVRAQTGQKLHFWRAFVREIPGRFLCGMLLSPIGYLTVLNRHSRAQTLADELAKTVVVKKRKKEKKGQKRQISIQSDKK